MNNKIPCHFILILALSFMLHWPTAAAEIKECPRKTRSEALEDKNTSSSMSTTNYPVHSLMLQPAKAHTFPGAQKAPLLLVKDLPNTDLRQLFNNPSPRENIIYFNEVEIQGRLAQLDSLEIKVAEQVISLVNGPTTKAILAEIPYHSKGDLQRQKIPTAAKYQLFCGGLQAVGCPLIKVNFRLLNTK